MSAAYLIAAVRTPGGKAKKGKLRDVRPDDLAAVAIRAAVERARDRPGRGSTTSSSAAPSRRGSRG